MSYPIKLSFKSEILPIVSILILLLASYYFYYHFPSTVVTHWNWEGNPDGWGSGKTNALALPLVILGMYFLFLVIPLLDPKKERYAEFSKVYHIFKNLFVSFMSIIFVLTGLSNLGYAIPIGKIIPLMIGLLFVFIGNYMGKIKFNWFVGVRTPWTLSNEEVWNKTHRFSGKVFILGGVLIAIDAWIPSRAWSLGIFIFTMAMLTFGTMIYSYWQYKKLNK